MKIFVIKTLSGLVPASRNEFDKLQEAKLALNELYQVELKKPRNIKFHRKFFALINLCFENQDQFENQEDLRYYLTMKAGYYKRINTPTGQMILPKSIKFTQMDDTEFSDLYEKVIHQVIKLIGCEREDLLNELENF